MFENWNLKKHIIMSTILSAIICIVSYIIINPLESAVIGLITDRGDISVNMGIVHVIVITLIALLLTLCSYIIINKKK